MVIVSEVGKQLVVEELRRDEGAWMLWSEDIWSHSRPCIFVLEAFPLLLLEL